MKCRFVLPAAVLALAVMPLHAQQPQRERPLPPGIKALRNLEYVPGGGVRQSLDLFLPENASAPLPLIVWVHGGAWRAGSKEHNPALPLLRDGYAVASINYRFTDTAIFPAQIQDCKAAIRFLRARAKEHDIDPDRIGVWGASAGGHLVALLGTTADVKELEAGTAENTASTRVQAVCNWFGPSNFLTVAQQGGDRRTSLPVVRRSDSPESQLIGGLVTEKPDKARAASPVTYASKDDAPFLTMHGDRDTVVPVEQSKELHETLVKAGVDSTLHIVEGGGHGQGFDKPEIKAMIREFFAKHLRKR